MVDKQVKVRENATWQSSVTFNADESNGTSNASKAVNRNEKNWQSSVFAGPKIEPSKRTRLNKNDKGREALFGDTMEPDAYQKKTNLAAAISTREATREPQFDNAAAEERKARELYGNSAYAPIGKEKNRQFLPAQVGMDAQPDRNTKNKKVAQLVSNVFGLDDEETIAKKAQWNPSEKLVSNVTGWSSQDNMKKTTNAGGVDAYRQKQNQLLSNVLEQTDYSAFEPMSKKQINTNDFNKVPEKMTPKKPITDINYEREREKRVHDPKTAKQSQLVSAFDKPREYPKPQEDNVPVASPVKGRNETQKQKLQNLTSNIHGLANDANKFYHQPQNKGEVIDLVLSGLKSNIDEIEVKKIANVKHVISSQVDLDNLKGTCTGTGRIKIRLNEGEDPEAIKQRFISKNILVQDFKMQPSKSTGFTKPIY